MGHEPRPWIRAAREKRERGADVTRRVMERAAQGQFLVVEAMGVDAELGAALAAPEVDDRAARPNELERPLPRLGGACGLDHHVRAHASAGLAAELRYQRAPLRPAADH